MSTRDDSTYKYIRLYIMIVSKYWVATRYKAHLWNAYMKEFYASLLREESFRLSKQIPLVRSRNSVRVICNDREAASR